jgi:hypothetical protein
MANVAMSTNTQSNTMGIANVAVGKIVTDGGSPAVAQTINLGFTPRYFRLINLTDRIEDEWFEGMAAASSLHAVAAGTGTLETTNGVTVVGNAVTFTAVTMLASKTFSWMAIG